MESVEITDTPADQEWTIRKVDNKTLSPELQRRIEHAYFDQGQEVSKIFQTISQTKFIYKNHISDHLQKFTAPTFQDVYNISIPRTIIEKFEQIFSFVTVKQPERKLTDFLTITSQLVETSQICIVAIMGINVAGMLQILQVSICANRNPSSILRTLKDFVDFGFQKPKSILCDSLLIVQAA